MKRSTVMQFLGFFVVIAVIDNAQGEVMINAKCQKFLNKPTKEDTDVVAKCMSDVKVFSDSCDHKMKIGACVLKAQKYLANGKFSTANYESHIDAKFKDAKKAAAAKKGVTKNCAKDGQVFKSDKEIDKLLTCMTKYLSKGCSNSIFSPF